MVLAWYRASAWDGSAVSAGDGCVVAPKVHCKARPPPPPLPAAPPNAHRLHLHQSNPLGLLCRSDARQVLVLVYTCMCVRCILGHPAQIANSISIWICLEARMQTPTCMYMMTETSSLRIEGPMMPGPETQTFSWDTLHVAGLARARGTTGWSCFFKLAETGTNVFLST